MSDAPQAVGSNPMDNIPAVFSHSGRFVHYKNMKANPNQTAMDLCDSQNLDESIYPKPNPARSSSDASLRAGLLLWLLKLELLKRPDLETWTIPLIASLSQLESQAGRASIGVNEADLQRKDLRIGRSTFCSAAIENGDGSANISDF